MLLRIPPDLHRLNHQEADMKNYLAVAISLILPLGLAPAVQAQAMRSPHTIRDLPADHIAQFGNIRLPGSGQDEDEAEDTESQAPSQSFDGFSGNYSEYLDDYNGFKVDIPEEFTLSNQGQTTDWTGPIINEGAVSIYVNAAPLPGVDPGTLQQTYRQQYEEDRFYTDVETLSVPYGDRMVPALRAREVDNRRGSRDQKAPDDIHRWHLFVFGNERVYTWGFTGMFQTFQDNEVQTLYEDVISSVELIPIVE